MGNCCCNQRSEAKEDIGEKVPDDPEKKIDEIIQIIINSVKNKKDKNIKKKYFDILCNYIKDEKYLKYRFYFLKKLNKYRAGHFELHKNSFNFVKDIFSFYLEILKKEGDIKNINFIIILSVTFYYLKGENKIFLSDELKQNEIFQDLEIWKKLLILYIKGDRKEVDENHFFSGIIAEITNMKIFGIDKNKIYDFYEYLNEEYKSKTSDVLKEIVANIIEGEKDLVK